MKLYPKCIHEGKEDAYMNTGHIMPCCMVDNDGNDKWLVAMRADHLKVQNVSSVKEIHHSKEWLDFHKMLIEDPNDAPPICKIYCQHKSKLIAAVNIGSEDSEEIGTNVRFKFKKMKKMKKRVVFSLYIDIPKEDLDWQPPHHGHTIPKTEHTKIEFQKHAAWLREMHEKYCESIEVGYRLFEYDDAYKEYRDWFLETYPQITHYNIVNFYKIHCMYELAKEYDEILYLDYDVIPVTTENFFDAFDLSKGFAIMEGLAPTQKPFPKEPITLIRGCLEWMPSIRSPAAKWWNCKALAILTDLSSKQEDIYIFNTGIVGASKEQLKKLDYFGNFSETLELMDELKANEDEMWPECLQQLFGWDNETIWAYKTKLNEVSWSKLGQSWHHFMDKENYIPTSAKFIHVINKNFDYVKNWVNSGKTS